MKKILISAGEASGDFYGAELAKHLLAAKKGKVTLIGFGGAKMRAAGVDVRVDLVKHAVMGFWEVFKKLFTFMALFEDVFAVIKNEKPDVLVVIDNPGFHLRLIKKARQLGVKKIVYYITPQVWVWKYKRVKVLKKYTDLCIVALPFEKDILKKEGINVKYFGHPMSPYLKPAKASVKKKLIGIFPGSRQNEIKSFFEDILKSCALIKMNYAGAEFVLFKADTVDDSVIASYLKKYAGLKIRVVNGWDIKVKSSLSAAIAKSGTTTLELALMGIPMAVVYRLSGISYMIIKNMANGRFVSLPNIILDKEAVKEFIQRDFTPENVSHEILHILNDRRYESKIKKDFAVLRQEHGRSKDVVKKIAAEIACQAGL